MTTSLVDELERRLRVAAIATIAHWDDAPRADDAPTAVKTAMHGLSVFVDSGPVQLQRAVERVVRASAPSLRRDASWVTDPLRATIGGLYFTLRALRRSPGAMEVLELNRDVLGMANDAGALSEENKTRLSAAGMAVDDAVFAIEGYRAAPPFEHTDGAYLAKFGLLQALQVGFDAAEATAAAVGLKVRADRVGDGKIVKVTRNLVAGHPLGGTYDGKAWEHFHDRGSAHDKSVIKIMSFQSDDPTEWIGQAQSTEHLMETGLAVMAALLRQVQEHLSKLAATTRTYGRRTAHPSGRGGGPEVDGYTPR